MSRYVQIKQKALMHGMALLEQLATEGDGNYEDFLDDRYFVKELWTVIPERFTQRRMLEMLAGHPELFSTDTSEFIFPQKDLLDFFRQVVRQAVYADTREVLVHFAIGLGIPDSTTYWAREQGQPGR
jgi:hypothetical protein